MPRTLLSTAFTAIHNTSKKNPCPPRVNILEDFQLILKIWKIDPQTDCISPFCHICAFYPLKLSSPHGEEEAAIWLEEKCFLVCIKQ